VTRQLIENIKINLTFYRRNRLVQLIALFLLIIFCFMLIPSVIFDSSTMKFKLIRRLQSQMSAFIMLTTAALALLTIHYHTRSRCIKMVLTKPCLPETWLLSVFLSAILLCFILHAISFSIMTGLFIIWQIPFQWGLIFITLESFAKTVVIYSYLTMLTSLMHPALAALIALGVNEMSLYMLITFIMSSLQGVADPLKRFFLKSLEQICTFFYIILPNYSPFSDDVSAIQKSYRVTGTEWLYLLYILGYAFLFAAFSYFATTFFFKRKRYM
jgi:hypothetical protein